MRRLADELERDAERHNHPRRRKTLTPKEDPYDEESNDASLEVPDEWNTLQAIRKGRADDQERP